MPKIVDHQAYRRELLERAAPLFLHYGFEALTTRRLARQLKVSTGTLYHYFQSKEQLFECLVQEWMAADMSWVRDVFAAIPGRQARIQSVGQFLEEHRQKFDTQNQLVLHYCRLQQQKGVDMTEFWQPICQGWDRLTRDMLELRSDFAADLMGTVIDGLFMQWLQGGPRLDLEHFFERLAHWLPILDEAERAPEQDGESYSGDA